MTPLHQVIKNKNTKINPIWIMRQAGRYLPEFRAIRKLNPNFIKLCLNNILSSEITLQPLKRFNLDDAIIFSYRFPHQNLNIALITVFDALKIRYNQKEKRKIKLRY